MLYWTCCKEYSPGQRDQCCFFGDEVPSVLEVLARVVRHTVRCDVPPSETLLHDSIDIWKRGHIRMRGQTVGADDGVELSLRFALHLRVQPHGYEKELEGRGGLPKRLAYEY